MAIGRHLCVPAKGLTPSAASVGSAVALGGNYQQVSVVGPGAAASRYKLKIQVAFCKGTPGSGDWLSVTSLGGYDPTNGDAYSATYYGPAMWARAEVTNYTTGDPVADGVYLTAVH